MWLLRRPLQVYRLIRIKAALEGACDSHLQALPPPPRMQRLDFAVLASPGPIFYSRAAARAEHGEKAAGRSDDANSAEVR
jgi:hypothetical protein